MLVFSTNDGACTKTFSGLKGIISPAWSPDGKQMVFISPNGIELMDVIKVIPAEFLSPQKLCQSNN
jgi:Tol biopolymer transport system component